MLTAAQKKKNVCIVVSDLEAAYDSGSKLIQRALHDAAQEVGRMEINITPVNLESQEIYDILRKRLFASLPNQDDVAEVASIYAEHLGEAARAKSVERSAEALASEIEGTYPFHPSFKSIVALFKENEKFKQTRGLMELVSRLLLSVWEGSEDVYLMGAQHFDLSIGEVREKLSEISGMRDVIARDLWDSAGGAHAQEIDSSRGTPYAKQVGTLLLAASLSTAVNSVKGLSESELLQCLIDPLHKASDFRPALEELKKSAWYLHQTGEGRHYFDRQENLTKKLQGYAEKAPQNKVDELIRDALQKMFQPGSKEAYEAVLPLPELDEAKDHLKRHRTLLIIDPDGKIPPRVMENFYQNLLEKNNILILTGERSTMGDVEKAARHLYAARKAEGEMGENHPHKKELEEKITHYQHDFQSCILGVFDKLLFPAWVNDKDDLRSKPLNGSYSTDKPYNGEAQIIKTLTEDPLKLYTDIPQNFDALKSRAEQILFGPQEDAQRSTLQNNLKIKTRMPWLPTSKGFDRLADEAFKRGAWEDLQNGYITRKPREKTTEIMITPESHPDDEGRVRLRVAAVHAGNAYRIHYAEEGEVSPESPVLTDDVLSTRALKVQLLAVDPSGKHKTGSPKSWQNSLVLRHAFDASKRTMELFVAPRGTIRYTLDGSEPRNGTEYTAPLHLGSEAGTVYVFGECQGLEARSNFPFPKADEKGSREVLIDPLKPAELRGNPFKSFDTAARIYRFFELGRQKGLTFSGVWFSVGSGEGNISLTMGDIKLSPDKMQQLLSELQSFVEPQAPLVLKFKKAYAQTGHDMKQFIQELELEVQEGEIFQA